MRALIVRSLAVALASVRVVSAQDGAPVPVPEVGVAEGPADGVRMSRSSSRQFIVRAREGRVRGAFCEFAEKLKGELLALLRQRDLWRFPVVIEIRGHTTAINVRRPVRTTIFKKPDSSYRLQVDVELGDSFTREVLRTELIRLLLAEEILRSHPEVDLTGRAEVLPDWLRVGVSEAIEFRRRDRPTELFASIFKSEKMLSVSEIIHPQSRGLDSVSSAIYKASCCGFVLSLVGQDDGPTRLRKMIGDLAIFRGTPKALLEKHFPGASGSDNSLEKWWALELATMAQPTVKDILDPLETERALGRCLQVRFVAADASAPALDLGERRKFWQMFRSKSSRDGEAAPAGDQESLQVVTVDLVDYRKFIDHPDREKLLGDVEVKLLQLSYRAFPLHRPLIREYQRLLYLLGRRKTKGVDESLEGLAAARIAIVRSAADASDYLNWYQATQVGQHSGAFSDYKAAVEELRKPPSRRDPLSKYLDELDKEFR